MQIHSFHVEGLFGKISHTIHFSGDTPVTIIAGPNGIGKTHILKLITAILEADGQTIADIPFARAVLKFSDGRSLAVSRRKTDVEITGFSQGSRVLGVQILSTGVADLWHGVKRPPGPPNLPTAISDMSSLNQLNLFEALFDEANHYSHSTDLFDKFRRARKEHPRWLTEILYGRAPILIDTKRLDTRIQSSDRPQEPIRSRIDEYIEQVRVQVTEARAASLAASQAADRSFAKRVLERSGRAIREQDLKHRYEEIAEQNAELYRSGLSEAQVDVKFPSNDTDPTERRVLALFIEDWRNKLAPLLPVNDKLKILRRIINDKFIEKSLRLDKSGGSLLPLAAKMR
ncbi:hypothetical protein GA0074692_2836 [Micromonospora pallida]|uniref:AAA domain-containing protein n=2 Tax=Micromonospora pallida TaxID=145854 RepID=A0A1C6SKD3_9ACTN|nr:hypothetical protein GA0074692_2836 [Micromonospora pallida]